jgi:hypothetical protein
MPPMPAQATLVEGKINDRWDLWMPDFRASFHAERPKWEAGRLAQMAEVVEPGWTIYDVGAEHGDFTALYRRWVNNADPASASGDVIPFEPSIAYWPCITQTWEANVNAWTAWSPGPPGASYVGFVSNLDAPHPEARWGTYIGTWPEVADGPVVADPGFRHLGQQGSLFAQTRLDTFAIETGLYPDGIVIDIEGAEGRALRGLSRLAVRGIRPHVWVSWHEPTAASWYDTNLFDLMRTMSAFGYGPGVELPHHGEGETFWYWSAP